MAVVGAVVLVVSAATAALAAKGPPPKHATVTAVQKIKVKINRYIQDGLRWNKDTYQVRSGGTITVVNRAAGEGPHTLTVVNRKDLPRTAKQVNECAICQKLGEAHGADPNSEAPPKFLYLENGVGQNTPPDLDQPGDSGVTGEKKGDSISFKVTAKKGTTLHFMCLIHPWMQGKILVR